MPQARFWMAMASENSARGQPNSVAIGIWNTPKLARTAKDSIRMTQPAISKSLHELESQVGGPLFVRGKRGVGYCKSMNGAIQPFQRMQQRHNAKPTDKIFGKTPTGQMNTILDELNLKKDRDGNVRTAYSLRHTYICLRLMEGADIYQIAKNCRTSVEMVEKFYAAHLKNTLDASAINVRKSKKKPKKQKN